MRFAPRAACLSYSYRPVPTLGAAALRRLRSLPDHPVHAVAMHSLAEQFNGDVAAGMPHQIVQLTCGDELRGYAMWHRVDGWDGRPGPHVKLDYLYVRRPKRGDGSALLRWLLEHADAHVTVLSTSFAREFYVKHGFEVDGAHTLRLFKPARRP